MKTTIYLLSISLFFVSCEKEEKTTSEEFANRTIIVYMVADNDLSEDTVADIEEIQAGYQETGTNLLVFVNQASEAPYLLKIEENNAERIKTYPDMNTLDKNNMHVVLAEIIQDFPAESYGLILWSHGTSWLPAGVRLKAFGDDRGKQMNIVDLAEALPIHLDFIIFDACLMGAVEVAYELRKKTDFIIASSTETIYEGFPYDIIIQELLQSEIDLQIVAQQYFDFYNNLTGAYRSATISVVNTGELDNLATEMSVLVAQNTLWASFDRTKIQRLDVYQEQYTFDLLDFVKQAFPTADPTQFISQLNRVVTYKAHTPQFLKEFDIEHYCGLSCYITHPQRKDLNDYYKTLQWTNDSGIINLLE